MSVVCDCAPLQSPILQCVGIEPPKNQNMTGPYQAMSVMLSKQKYKY